MREMPVFMVIGLVLVACAPEPEPILVEDPPPEAVCGNGTLEQGEACDGALAAADSCVSRGFAEGELSCTADCRVDTVACVGQDDDLDGLAYHDELSMGTDPTLFDTDGDGIGDGVEASNGSDPLNRYSWPAGMWPNRLAAAKADGLPSTGTGTGMDVGDVGHDFVVTDQFGEAMQLHQLYGYVVVVSVGAVWCGPCHQAAQGSEALYQEYVGEGVVFLEVLIDGNTPGVPTQQQEIDNWVSTYGITFPVSMPDDRSDFEEVASIPTFFIFDRQMRLHQLEEGFPGDTAIGLAITKALNASE